MNGQRRYVRLAHMLVPAVVLLSAGAARADVPVVTEELVDIALPALKHNPFDRPERLMRPGVTGGEAPSVASRMTLRGVLLAGENSLANVDGKILAVGERIGEFTLVKVTDTAAVLRGDSVTMELTLAQVREATSDSGANADLQETEQ